MYLRAFRVCSPQYIDNELNTIAAIGKRLCYPQWFLDRCASRAESRYHRNNINDSNTANCITPCLPYHKPFESVSQLLSKFNVRVVYKYENTIKNLLIKNSPNNDRCCIYKIPCKQCNRFYIGQTAKSVPKRISQHKRCITRCESSSALFMHMSSLDHPID